MTRWTNSAALHSATAARAGSARETVGSETGMGEIFGYMRASSGDQDITGQDLADHHITGHRITGQGIAGQGIAGQIIRLNQTGAVKVFSDIGSGSSMDRPGFAALLASARSGDTLAVVGLDRLGRSLTELLTTVAMLKERGVALISLDDRIDTRSAGGALIFQVFGAIAHCERRLVVERTKGGIVAARARGKRRGRPPLDTDKITAALKLVEAGLSPAAAARQLRLGRSTIYREVSRAGIERVAQSRGSWRSSKP
jgi:DNA invertase Pin-like site-specific DNA recombinase